VNAPTIEEAVTKANRFFRNSEGRKCVCQSRIQVTVQVVHVGQASQPAGEGGFQPPGPGAPAPRGWEVPLTGSLEGCPTRTVTNPAGRSPTRCVGVQADLDRDAWSVFRSSLPTSFQSLGHEQVAQKAAGGKNVG
jgi:hypothetical protein